LDITLYDIFNALEGQFSVPTIETDIDTSENDVAMGLWKEIGTKINNILKEYKLSDLVES
jgi:DNA-binding IscR family transcriptional regulator